MSKKFEEYPKLLYRAAENGGQEVHGIQCQCLEVADADAEAAALAEGWHCHPDEIDVPAVLGDPVAPAGTSSLADVLAEKDEAIETLTAERDRALQLASENSSKAQALTSEVERLKGGQATDRETISNLSKENEKLKSDLKAAEELAEGETKVKDVALAELAEAQAEIAAFDKDGDGKAGGSKPRGKAPADGASE